MVPSKSLQNLTDNAPAFYILWEQIEENTLRVYRKRALSSDFVVSDFEMDANLQYRYSKSCVEADFMDSHRSVRVPLHPKLVEAYEASPHAPREELSAKPRR
jgi:hypothetical protein